ncbi:L domain-like protein [Neocallimastix californiae]|uniref:L domain-like protein n=1 Tax=Neocallimastix californiae TaxID=1754190 RepID=A0A1Y1ZJ69_9FUNG|nr:L domain-like protein [Neocallimastix californiae]|eukprot:ORY10292.1 L domain-like protein [Neocallimastix californiae]
MVNEVPMSLSKLSNLKEIDISNNDFIQFPSSIGSLPSLKILNAEDCEKLKSLPDSIGNLETLEELYLNNCAIKSLPDSFSNLKHLKVLKMYENKLSTIPQALSKITSLEEINISKNKIDDEIPVSLNDLPNLKKFEIEGNINIKGKTLTNKSLIYCSYLDYDDYESKTISLCKAKDMDCFQFFDDIIGNCPKEASTTTTTTNPKKESLEKIFLL